ncbi:MAG TPA: esterase-like activity of phytase family protein, partial [Tepidisphaeraceae bacterium]|nr:esterase-like activity of phytase family protein [Tepidisphaeraceae bacterium]
VDPVTGAVSNFQIKKTIFFKTADGSQHFNGLSPSRLPGGTAGQLGLSFDPEGFVVAPNGNFYVSDEYGPSLYEFKPVDAGNGVTEARFVRAFQTPSNVLPVKGGQPNFEATPTTGRQTNRGFEGLAISPDGSKLYAVLQSPNQNEGLNTSDNSLTNAGRYSRNVRIVEFDAATGEQSRQLIYQFEDVADINARVPGTDFDFKANQQGRLAVSGLAAINADELLVLERDGRGIGIENPVGDPTEADSYVGTKRIYKIRLSDATDVTNVDLTGTNALPADVAPVSKQLFADVQMLLDDAGLTIPDKFEGITFGPALADGSLSLLLGTDNDFSVTQDEDTSVQFDVYTNGTAVRFTPIDDPSKSFASLTSLDQDLGALPGGYALLPGYLYGLKAAVDGYVAPAAVPLPGAMAMGLATLAAGGAARGMKRLRRHAM